MQDVGNLALSGRVFKKHANDYEQRQEICSWDDFRQTKLLLEYSMDAKLKIGVQEGCNGENHPRSLRRAPRPVGSDRLRTRREI